MIDVYLSVYPSIRNLARVSLSICKSQTPAGKQRKEYEKEGRTVYILESEFGGSDGWQVWERAGVPM